MQFVRNLTDLFIRSAILAIVGVFAVSIVPDGASAQSGPVLKTKIALQSGAATQLDQRIIAQLGLGVGLETNVLKSQLQLIDILRAKVGVCIAANNEDGGEDDGGEGGGNNANSVEDGGGDGGDEGSGSIKLVQLKVSSATTIDALVEVYYDSQCKKVFIHAPMTVRPVNQNGISFTETAAFFKMNGTALGKLSVNGTGTKSATALDFSGTGTFVPSNGGVHVIFGLDCAFPTSFLGAEPFVCSGGVVTSINSLKLDVGLASTVKTKVKKVGAKSFVGSFTGIAKLMAGDFGKLGISINGSSVSITGPSTPLCTATIAGSERLSGVSPSLTSWTVTDADCNTIVAIDSAKGQTPGFSGTIKDINTAKTLATFSVDESGTGSIVYSNNQKAGITGWIVAE